MIFLKVLVVIMALVLLSKSLLVYIRKKPLIISITTEILTIAVPYLVSMLLILKTSEIINYFPIFLMLTIALFFLNIIIKGIYIYGTSKTEIWNMITKYLNDNKIEFEHIPSAIFLKKYNITLNFSFSEKYGFGRILVKGKDANSLNNKILDLIRHGNIKFNLSYSVFALVFGLGLILLSLL